MIRTLFIGGVVLGVPLFFVLVFVMSSYNKLSALRKRYQKAYSEIDEQLTRRYDLVLRLLGTAKDQLSQEPEILQMVIAARNAASAANVRAARDPGHPAAGALASAEIQLVANLRRLLTWADTHPNLKTNAALNSLREELACTESKVAIAYQAFNDQVIDYNTARRKFPTNLIALLFHFNAAELCIVPEPEQKEASKP